MSNSSTASESLAPQVGVDAKFYFHTKNANREYSIGGYSFRFDRVKNIAGSWRGVLSTSDEKKAKVLRAYGSPVSEITQEEYEAEKKTVSNTSFFSPNRPAIPQRLTPEVVNAATESEDSDEGPVSSEKALDAKMAVTEAPVELKDELAEAAAARPKTKKPPRQLRSGRGRKQRATAE